jgi:hypothetical protein
MDAAGIAATSHPRAAADSPNEYEMTVTAFQQLTGNTGVDRATLIIPVPPSTQS